MEKQRGLRQHGTMESLLEIIRPILGQPTAPFHEDAVRGELLMQLAQIPGVAVERDDYGNVVARYGSLPARYAFAAHMDHPAYVFKPAAVGEETTSQKAVEGSLEGNESWEFLGGVPPEWRKNGKTRDFGAFAMWDLPACEVKDGRIHSRACDDLIGCAAIVALFAELAKSGVESGACGLFTRAEEVGFAGAVQLARSGRVPKELTIVSLECSSERSPGAGKMGDGVIVRVGDRTSIFDDAATASLTQAATAAKIPFQRCLMSGGTCEATAYQLYGYRSAALCVALGNYHNCGPDHQIAPEFVAVDDVLGMVSLMKAAVLAEASHDPHAALRERIEKGVAKYQDYW